MTLNDCETLLSDVSSQYVDLLTLVENEKRAQQQFLQYLQQLKDLCSNLEVASPPAKPEPEQPAPVQPAPAHVQPAQQEPELEIQPAKQLSKPPAPNAKNIPSIAGAKPLKKTGGRNESNVPVIDYAKLKNKEALDGLNTNRLEMYLSDEQFHEVFDMSREEFSKLANWQQARLKKSMGLF